MNPIELKDKINKALGEAILDRLPVTDNETADVLKEAIENYPFVSDPFIEQQPLYKRGGTLQELVDADLLHPYTTKLFALSQGVPNDDAKVERFCRGFRLYLHQERSLKSVLQDGKNLVVCSGTGSGKTECFMLPLIDDLVREKVKGNKGRGVRALLLYPMNALVNDQLRRLRNILKHCYEIEELRNNPITFGRFTGETPIKEMPPYDLTQSQMDKVKELLPKHSRVESEGLDTTAICSNEVCRRSEWCNHEDPKKGPADILVTNYSMLERLLLKPNTSAIFKRGNFWKFIILDEAHSYNGAQGTEIAWLLRRVNQRVNRQGNLRFLATSATLVDGSCEDLQQTLRNAGVSESLWSERQDDAQYLKETFIKHAFASKIFPAEAESFFIEFGEQADMPEHSGYSGGKSALEYVEREVPQKALDIICSEETLKNQADGATSCLKHFLPCFWGLQKFWKELLNQFPKNLQASEGISAGRLLELLRAMNGYSKLVCVGSGADYKTPVTKQLNIESVLDKDKSQLFFTWLFDILEEAIAPIDLKQKNKEAWSDYLHDKLDTSAGIKSAIDENNDFGAGNRIYLLDEWNELKKGTLEALSIEGLDYLLRVGHQVLVEADAYDYSPVRLGMKLTDEFCAKAQEILEKPAAIYAALKDVADVLADDAKTYFDLKDDMGGIENMLGTVLLADPQYRSLREYIANCHARQNDKAPKDSEFSLVAKHVYPDETEDIAKEKLDKLNTVATFSRDSNNCPLWDIRYHQMVRGVPGATIQFKVESLEDAGESEEDYRLVNPRIELNTAIINDPGADREHHISMRFPLGICLKCGQPYLIGYATEKDMGKSLQLYPHESEQHSYQYAFSWVRNKEVEYEPEKSKKKSKDVEEYWLDPYAGKLYRDDHGNGCVCVRVYYGVHATESYGIIGKCGCCGLSDATSKQDGIIAVYSGYGDFYKSVVMAAILEQLPPSLNPVARAHPGEGRKLLAFSDSRIKSARLALDFDRYVGDRNTDLLLYEALRDEEDRISRRDEIEWRVDYGDPEPDDDDERDAVKNYTFKALGVAFRNRIVDHDLIEQYLKLDYDYKERAEPMPMRSWDAAMARLIEALRRRNPNHILDRAGGYMDHKELDNIVTALANTATAEGIDFDKEKKQIAREKLGELMIWLLKNGRIRTGPSSYPYPEALLYPGQQSWYRNLYLLAKDAPNVPGGIIKLETSRRVKKLMADVLTGTNEQVKECLKEWLAHDCWRRFKFILDHELNLFDNGLTFRAKKDANPNETVPLVFRIEEHSAQVASEMGGQYQRAFAQGRINVLSCSTTFEMGVDLGDLSCVFLGNQPPSVANYKQRAGRAGRRAGMGAMVFTFIGANSHDEYYFKHPEDMFFGTVNPPMIYLENPVFRARHLRAEALHKFLVWRKDREGKNVKRWESSGWFFFGMTADRCGDKYKLKKEDGYDSWISSLEEWADSESASDAFKDHINAIIAGPEQKEINYDVVKDLVWQMKGIMPPVDKMTRDLAYRLAGPNMNDGRDFPMEIRMFQKLSYIYGGKLESQNLINHLVENWSQGQTDDVARKVTHLFHQPTIDFLSRNRVLPLYGFPSDVIEMDTSADKKYGRDIDLSRDMKQGIYEYAPGCYVTANKRVFRSSNRVGYYYTPKLGVEGGELGINVDIAKVCLNCGTVFTDEDEEKGCCSKKMLVKAMRPDFFKADPSSSGQSVGYAKPTIRLQRVLGKMKHLYSLKGMNLEVLESAEKKVVYLNTNNKNGFKESENGVPFALMHTVHTDVLQLKLRNDVCLFSNVRKKNAWNSVAAALQRAMQNVLKVQKSDIGVLPNLDDWSWYIYDASPGGAGFVYRLLLSEEMCTDLIDSIINESIRICSNNNTCSCYQEACKQQELGREPAKMNDVLDQPKKYRNRYSCYSCLRDFSNSAKHDTLDVLDAVTVLKLMLNKNGNYK